VSLSLLCCIQELNKKDDFSNGIEFFTFQSRFGLLKKRKKEKKKKRKKEKKKK
jgi:hypothetical protein